MIEPERQCISPSELNEFMNQLFSEVPVLSDVWVEGEITQLKHYKLGGQIYFNLSDGRSQINCVMFDSALSRIQFEPKEGQSVKVRGKMRVFSKRGSLSFQVNFMLQEGLGDLAKQFLKLKEALTKEGLFNPDLKKTIPSFPSKVALITSPGSAAMTDVLTIMQKQSPEIAVTIVPATMQGADAPKSIQSALLDVDRFNTFELVIIARGGGSNEDLACFNDEALIRAIFSTQTPVISAVGHDIDVTLCDYVADLRAQTPTQAAHLVSSPTFQLKQQTRDLHARAIRLLGSTLERLKNTLIDTYYDGILTLDRKTQTIEKSYTQLHSRLGTANPLHKLKQGFSICTRYGDSSAVKTVDDINIGDTLITRLQDGAITSKVTGHEKRDPFN
jgi:exodeoxyribonuclease VII large subunit